MQGSEVDDMKARFAQLKEKRDALLKEEQELHAAASLIGLAFPAASVEAQTAE